MVNDPSTDHLISWSAGGKSFIIQNQAQFWYELLPVYYKHNNMSSFVRQLNMYGFHKMSTVENGAMDIEKDEIQFFHQYFQKDQPELLKMIKRKVTGTKVASGTPVQNVIKSDDLSKVLSDVKHLRGRQASVDSQLSAMKQENAVLWRELAMLRQKHMKQQQIVNKLIQFLVTIVQPNTRMGGLGVKRHYPLMLSECPPMKKEKKQTTEGPTIHELDNSETVPEELFEDKEEFLQSNRPDSVKNQKKSSELLEEVYNMELNTDIELDSPEYVLVVDQQPNPLVDELLSDTELPAEALAEAATPGSNVGDSFDNLDDPGDLYSNNEKIFLNSNAPDTLLTNLINGSYNSDLIKDNNKQNKKDGPNSDLSVARVEFNRMNSLSQDTHPCSEDLDNHVEKTQGEIDQLKDILHGCNTLDANALLGLFSDDAPDYGITYTQSPDDDANKSDPLVSGSELATYTTGLIDFSQLFDDTSDPQDIQQECVTKEEPASSINTPQISNDVPLFPDVKVKNERK
ncbi:putative sequence-specific DNA binding protein [Trypoxylus dichotomus]